MSLVNTILLLTIFITIPLIIYLQHAHTYMNKLQTRIQKIQDSAKKEKDKKTSISVINYNDIYKNYNKLEEMFVKMQTEAYDQIYVNQILPYHSNGYTLDKHDLLKQENKYIQLIKLSNGNLYIFLVDVYGSEIVVNSKFISFFEIKMKKDKLLQANNEAYKDVNDVLSEKFIDWKNGDE